MDLCKMKILHVIAGLNRGGAEATLVRLSLSDADNVHVVVSLMSGGAYGEELRSAGIPIYELGFRRGAVTASGVKDLYRVLRQEKPDIVQTWMYHADVVGGLVAKCAGVKRIVWGIRNTLLDPTAGNWPTRTVARTAAVLSHLIPSVIVSCSRQALLQHASIGYRPSKLVYIPNGYDLGRFAPDSHVRRSVRESIQVAESDFLLGMVARWDPQKDHATLFNAAGRLSARIRSRWRLVLIGPDMVPSNKPLMELINDAKLRANSILLGPRSDVPELMKALDVHVLSSAYGEGFPNVVAEAMASGVPCVATDVGDASEIVGSAGWVVPPKDAGGLAEAMVQAYEAWSRPDDWVHISLASRRKVVSDYSVDAMVYRYRQVWARTDPGRNG
jgi:glycosyltransferase involved in cell wall biosynthesis